VTDGCSLFLAAEFFDDYAQESMLHDTTGTDDKVTMTISKNQ